MTKRIKVEYVKNLHPIFTKPKRVKIIVGGRGSTKSTGVADYVAAKVSSGELWCCARENQNSIEESVHRTILDEISRLGIEGFEDTKTSITHAQSGGRTFYRGLSRNITSLKSTLSGVDGLWIEEGEDISENTLRVLTASVRLSAKDTEALLGENSVDSIESLNDLLESSDINMPEIIITMNRGARDGAIAKKWLARADGELGRTGYYEDDAIMVVEMNYNDMPKSWFIASGLESERLDDFDKMSRAAYDHKWRGHYMDEVDGSIIKPEWFDAAIDLHLNPKFERLMKPVGAMKVAHDPSGEGNDDKGLAVRHGSIVTKVSAQGFGDIDDGCDWALDECIASRADWFIWDADGMGYGLKRQVSDALAGKKVQFHSFKGSLSGSGQDNAKKMYLPVDNDEAKDRKTYEETFFNNRSQYYGTLADKFFNSYRALTRGEYIDPSEMISIASAGCDNMEGLRSELCRIPSKSNGRGLFQIMSKADMLKLGIKSQNMGDAVMMTEWMPPKVMKRSAPKPATSISNRW